MTAVSASMKMISIASAGMDLFKMHHAYPQGYPFLLESVAHGHLGHYDILFAFPQETLSCQHVDEAKQILAEFNQAFHRSQLDNIETELPFHGGWFGYFSYEYAQVIEQRLHLPDSDLPLATLVRVPAAIIQDHQTQQIHFVTEIAFEDLLIDLQADYHQTKDLEWPNNTLQMASRSEESPQKYLQGVEAIKDYILAGDVFQVNLSREWQVQLQAGDYQSLYRSLRLHNPAPFAACVNWGDWQILSSSPERLVKTQHGWVETRPSAGTRKRSAQLAQDQALIDELISHPKEIAEHIMLIELERNDLGRICQPGSVTVNELMVVESYQHVHHIVSNVRGRLKSQLTPLEVIHATFPGGTITGCPKVRCMEIIAELEQMPRRAYTGSLGYINRDGSMDFNILIRTLLQQGQTVSFRAGAGIVADSEPQRELQESAYKAKGLLNALSPGLAD